MHRMAWNLCFDRQDAKKRRVGRDRGLAALRPKLYSPKGVGPVPDRARYAGLVYPQIPQTKAGRRDSLPKGFF